MKQGAKFAALLSAVLLMGGCFSSGGNRPKPAELTPVKSSVDLRQVWRASVGSAKGHLFEPAVVDDAVFAAGRDGIVVRFDNGKVVWRADARQPLSGGVGSDGRLVVVGTLKGEIFAFDGDGKPAWKARVNTEVIGAPVVAGGVVLVRSGDSRIFAFDANDGQRRWIYQRATPSLSLHVQAPITVHQDVVLAGFPGGKLVALNLGNGGALWELPISIPKGATELERMADVTSPAVVSGQEVCAAAYQGRVSCFDLGKGATLWGRDISSYVGIDRDERNVYVTDDKGAVHALDAASGNSVWKQDKLFLRGVGRPLAMGDYIAVTDNKGFVHLLNQRDGSFAARMATDGSAIRAPLQRLDTGVFLAQTEDGGLFAFQTR